MAYIPNNLANLMEFLRGDNSTNNPANINTAGTLTCNFPGYQLSKVNNLSSIVVLLKIAKHILLSRRGLLAHIRGVRAAGPPRLPRAPDEAHLPALHKPVQRGRLALAHHGWLYESSLPTPRSSTRRRRPLRSPSSTRDGPAAASEKDPRVFSQTNTLNSGKHRFYSKPCLGGLMGKRARVGLGYGRWVEGLAEADVFTNLVLSDCHGSRPLAPSEAAPITASPSCVVRGAAAKAILLVSPD
eukprot:XP_001705805.1 Hypothetical protein GL50803_113283 [Giardia lamblia ATCC 50803]